MFCGCAAKHLYVLCSLANPLRGTSRIHARAHCDFNGVDRRQHPTGRPDPRLWAGASSRDRRPAYPFHRFDTALGVQLWGRIARQGAAVVLARPAETRSTGWGWIYVSGWASSDSAGSFDDRVSADIAERRRAVGGDLNVTSAGRLKTRDGTVVVLRHLATRGVSGKSVYEVVAYAQNARILFGVKAPTEAALTATLPQFGVDPISWTPYSP